MSCRYAQDASLLRPTQQHPGACWVVTSAEGWRVVHPNLTLLEGQGRGCCYPETGSVGSKPGSPRINDQQTHQKQTGGGGGGFLWFLPKTRGSSLEATGARLSCPSDLFLSSLISTSAQSHWGRMGSCLISAAIYKANMAAVKAELQQRAQR